MTNIPVPSGPRAPKTASWFWWIGPAALIVVLYRRIPPRIRSKWCRTGNASSHLALAAILAGGGWSALIRFGTPHWRSGVDDPFVPFWLQKGPPR